LRISVEEAVGEFVKYQKNRIGDSDFEIVEGRWKTIETQMRTFLDYVRKDDKITALDESTLPGYERNGEITNYVSFRKKKGISDVTIRNEMTTINSFMKYCFADAKVTHVAAFKYPNMPKKNYKADALQENRYQKNLGSMWKRT
jgi:predicted transport protein|tara:strand:+ start:1450 stop:1881 length:432 start_codon:yes stop_codon:yes gene_type:complete